LSLFLRLIFELIDEMWVEHGRSRTFPNEMSTPALQLFDHRRVQKSMQQLHLQPPPSKYRYLMQILSSNQHVRTTKRHVTGDGCKMSQKPMSR